MEMRRHERRAVAVGRRGYYRRQRNVMYATQEGFPRWVTTASD
jgi:hypothetical protein